MKRIQHFALLALLALPAAVHAADLPAIDQVFTASTHPMKYVVSLPNGWSSDRKWPILIAPNAHYGKKAATIQMFAPLNEARHAGFIIVSPIVINSDPVAPMKEYQGAIADRIRAADAALGEGERDDDARAEFDSAGIRAIIKDVQRLYSGEDRVCLAGFSASTHLVFLFLFTHPELLKGAVINSGMYRGRGVDEDHLPLLHSPERARVAIMFIAGETDNGFKACMENWNETKTLLIQSGHPASQIRDEIIRKGNPDKLGTGHQWFPGRIMDFFAGLERAEKNDNVN